VTKFEGTIESARGGGAFIAVPPAAVKALGGGGRIPVDATFDGVAYRGSVTSMGAGPCIGILTAIRAQIGKDVGDKVGREARRHAAAPRRRDGGASALASASW